jgi:hypothetical protein
MASSIIWDKWKFGDTGLPTYAGQEETSELCFMVAPTDDQLTMNDAYMACVALSVGIPVHLRETLGASVPEMARWACNTSRAGSAAYTADEKKLLESKLNPGTLAAYQDGLSQAVALFKANPGVKLELPIDATFRVHQFRWRVTMTVKKQLPTLETEFKKLALGKESKKAELG